MSVPVVIFCIDSCVGCFAMIYAATRKESPLDVRMVIATPPSPTNEREQQYVHDIGRLQTFAQRANRHIPIYSSPPPYFFDSLPSSTMIVAGRPFTSLADLMQNHPDKIAKLGQLVIIAETTSATKQTIYPHLCDQQATNNLLADYPGAITILPTRLAKQYICGFGATDLAKLGIYSELAGAFSLQETHLGWQRSYTANLGLVMLTEQIAASKQNYPYRWQSHTITTLPAWLAEDSKMTPLDLVFATPGSRYPPRYIVTWQDESDYRARVKRILHLFKPAR